MRDFSSGAGSYSSTIVMALIGKSLSICDSPDSYVNDEQHRRVARYAFACKWLELNDETLLIRR